MLYYCTSCYQTYLPTVVEAITPVNQEKRVLTCECCGATADVVVLVTESSLGDTTPQSSIAPLVDGVGEECH